MVFAVLGGFSVWRLNHERQSAPAEAAHAQRSLQFTLNPFSAGPTNQGRPSDLRATELLAKDMQEAKSLQEDPLRQSEIFMTLGGVFDNTGDYDMARKDLAEEDAALEAQLLVASYH